ncbi:MAG: hypothetical protein FP825_11965 [Hyphomonas sp.]|uniref:hypothetical protein n=1 Tax=Hyphomonas sp. TaxID=87 RepID=UPI00180CB981|nr:hypothetical protein [Hyphomonas sp.]MBU3919691.1 hypothetical protein [Alphaproteobacteria bacterium]MBA3069181.1 hypothetical protein [Hyphomonas sp.]MBU4062366.1 hypothetical protein [Alphaproteobacteria bacterium]MBU4162748.1 hypothetical protein [Alphaproteobacteria bacterium]MBU4569340.1 hypothetical protein [Alphaproteobacteria bacterium]
MTARAVKSVTPFDFRADFGPQPEEAAGDVARVSFTGAEIAGLIAQVRAETLADVARVKAETESERLAAAAAELAQALEEIGQVMRLIETSQFHAATEARLRSLIDGAAARIVHGQGDLFAAIGHAPIRKEDRT